MLKYFGDAAPGSTAEERKTDEFFDDLRRRRAQRGAEPDQMGAPEPPQVSKGWLSAPKTGVNYGA